MRTILAVLDHLDTAHAVLTAAGLVARRLPQARIDVLHVRPVADPGFIASEEVMTPARQARFEAAAEARAATLRGIFDLWRDAYGTAITAIWREETGAAAERLAAEGGAAALVAIGRSAHHMPGNGRAAIVAVLFEAKMPVLLVPATIPASVGAHIAVAWKPSETAERAVVAALPLLRAAGRVTVLTEAEHAGDMSLPEELVRMLAESGHAATPHPFSLAGRPIGAALLAEARLVGADLLVMGAYTHRRSVEAVFGGATSDILGEADLPVFLHH